MKQKSFLCREYGQGFWLRFGVLRHQYTHVAVCCAFCARSVGVASAVSQPWSDLREHTWERNALCAGYVGFSSKGGRSLQTPDNTLGERAVALCV